MMVKPRNPESFVKVITRLIENPEGAKQIALCGREKVELKFHSGISACKIVQGLTIHTNITPPTDEKFM